MKAYELLFFTDPTLGEEDREATLAKIDSTITTQGGNVDNVNNWGRRKLAYQVDHLSDGDYTLIDFHSIPANIAEIDRVLRITDAVKRFIIVARTDRD